MRQRRTPFLVPKEHSKDGATVLTLWYWRNRPRRFRALLEIRRARRTPLVRLSGEPVTLEVPKKKYSPFHRHVIQINPVPRGHRLQPESKNKKTTTKKRTQWFKYRRDQYFFLFFSIFPAIFKNVYMSRGMGFPTMWYVRPAKPQISLRIRAV